jgi:5-methylcytosine-specific restriction endonuclease McrA
MKNVPIIILLIIWACCMIQAIHPTRAVLTVAGRVEPARSSKWEEIRDAYIKAHPTCAACGRKATQVHHIKPFHLYPKLELDPQNLISLCDRDHLLFGHLDNYQSYNEHVREDCTAMLARIKSRPLPM